MFPGVAVRLRRWSWQRDQKVKDRSDPAEVDQEQEAVEAEE